MEEAHEVYKFKDETGKQGLGGNTAMRKRLADISNLPQQSKAANREGKRQQTFTKEYVEKLRKEKEVIAGSLAERDSELEKMRVTVQKLQQQNIQLIQANGQMLVEFNLNKDRLRILQHELGCKNGILKAREIELKGIAKSEMCKKSEEVTVNISEAVELPQVDIDNAVDQYPNKQMLVDERTNNTRICSGRNSASFRSNKRQPYGDMIETEQDKYPEGTNWSDGAAESSQAGEECSELHISKTRQQSGSQSWGSSFDKQIQAKEKIDDKRMFSRRQSSRLRAKHIETSVDAVEMGSSQVPVSALPVGLVCRDSPTSSTSSAKIEDSGENSDPRIVYAHIQSAVRRPSRQAARKIQSYKEIPLNVKMRRPN